MDKYVVIAKCRFNTEFIRPYDGNWPSLTSNIEKAQLFDTLAQAEEFLNRIAFSQKMGWFYLDIDKITFPDNVHI